MTLRVVLLGFGGIGSRVAAGMRSGRTPQAALIGAVVRCRGRATHVQVREMEFDQALKEADLFIECAGVEAARQYGPSIINAGKDLLLVSVGAVADPDLRKTLFENGPGRTYITNGAIGGLDLLAAAAITGLDTASLTTSKRPETLVRPWMSDAEAERIRDATAPVTVFTGNVTDAIAKFPDSLNVAVALAHTTGLWRETKVYLIADPETSRTQHEVAASGRAGTYRISIENEPMSENPASSAIVSDSVLSGIRRLSGTSGIAV